MPRRPEETGPTMTQTQYPDDPRLGADAAHPDSYADYAAMPAEPVTLAHAEPADLVSDGTADDDDAPDRTPLAAGCIVTASAIWAFQDVAIKDLIVGMAVWQVLLFRSVAAALTLGGLWLVLGKRYQFWPKQLKPHLVRAALIMVCYTTFYISVPYVPMADVATLMYSAPIMITVLAIPLLRERVGLHRTGAVIVGFAGVFVITGLGQFNVWVLGPLFSAFTYAVAMIMVRKVGGVESALSLTLSLNLAYLLLSTVMVALGELVPLGGETKATWGHMWGPWVWPPADTWALIAALSVLGVVGHFLVSFGYTIAEASAVAVFDYAYIPLTAVAAYLMLGEVPGTASYVGMGLIIASGVYTAVRERTVAERRRKSRAARLARAPA
jgi:drug/metabolite transporter (DMT)-like permease